MVKVNIYSLMVKYKKVIDIMEICMEKDLWNILMIIMKVIRHMIKEKENENFYGLMTLEKVIYMKVNIKIIKEMDMEYINIIMVIYLMENGKIIKNMEKENL